ncbi:MAG: zf-HC2 domain-containing protein [bacterium]|nr:zf-HC2 domain-containing protein [bacterium]
MFCYFIRKKLAEYDEGALAPKSKHKVDQHLSQCADCMGELYTLRKTRQIVAELNNEPCPPESYWHQVWQRLRARLFLQ